MKTISQILTELELDENSTFDDIMNKLTLVTQDEINDIKTVSVKVLPNVSRDKATEIKDRLVNTIIDDDKGSNAILNKRLALLSLILSVLDTSKAERNNDEQTIVANKAQVNSIEDNDSGIDVHTNGLYIYNTSDLEYQHSSSDKETINITASNNVLAIQVNETDESEQAKIVMNGNSSDAFKFYTDALLVLTLDTDQHAIFESDIISKGDMYFDTSYSYGLSKSGNGDFNISIPSNKKLTLNDIEIPNKTYVDNADATLQNNINAEGSARSSADATLDAKITAEISDRTTAVTAEATARTAADATLQSNINAEANARISGLATKVAYDDVKNVLTDTSTNKPLSAYQGKVLKGMIDTINTLLASDDTDLDTIQEIIGYIKSNKSLIETLSSNKINFTDIVDNLTSELSNKPLSAKQGYVLKGYIDTINDAEEGIATAEGLRVTAENGRVQAENARVLAEQARATEFSGWESTLAGKEVTSNKVTELSSSSTDTQYPSAKVVYDELSEKADIDQVDNALLLKEEKANKVTSISASSTNTEYPSAKAVYDFTNAQITQAKKNLQWQLGTYDLGVEAVNGTTMLLPTPANTIQATVSQIDGASEVSENLIVLNDVAQTTENGITYKVENGIYTLNGTASATVNIIQNINISAGTYTLSPFANTTLNGNVHISFHTTGGTWIDHPLTSATSYSVVPTTNIDKIYVYVPSGSTVSNVVIKPMLVVGSTAPTEFKVGYTGIHNLELSGLKVEGANTFNFSNLVITNPYSTPPTLDTTNKTINGGWAYRFSTQDANATFISFDLENTSGSVYIDGTRVGSAGAGTKTYSLNVGTTHEIKLDFGSYLSNAKVSNIIVNRGNSAVAYVDYIIPTTLPIDLSTILYNGSPLFEENSLKAVGTAKDYITPYLAHKGMGKIILTGSLDWYVNSSFSSENNIAIYRSLPNSVNSSTNMILDKDFTIMANTVSSITVDIIKVASNNIVYLNFSAGGGKINEFTLQKAKEWLTNNPITLYYELATPIEVSIDFSQLVKFEAHSNGSITLVNTNNQDTTSTFKYLKEVAK